ncbi:hypothetical protein B296_00001095 [Ensete ventricosum]|uniref:Uncharacterized protein n=1 Tax=Ensete ventricosum TaxID=4639 RepID=A0A427BBD5_ENSVE|nr:hypothetical protein B296_00001095 [Ensete ventricosum]
MRYQIFDFVSSDTGLYQAIMVKTNCSRLRSAVCLGISLDTDVPYRSELDMPVRYKMADLDFDDRIILIME